MVNPADYGTPLVRAGERLVEQVAKALAVLWFAAISSDLPVTSLAAAQYTFNKRINAALDDWERSWQDWADRDLALAYLAEVRLVDADMRERLPRQMPTKEFAQRSGVMLKYPLMAAALLRPLDADIKRKFDRLPQHLAVFEDLRSAAYANLAPTRLAIGRAASDIYRQATLAAGDSRFVDASLFDRRAISQRLLDNFAEHGVQSVVYQDGRKVSVDVYAEMVGRTMTHHASLQASWNRAQEFGTDLVRISSHYGACPLCVPWQDRVVSLSGETEGYPTMDEAIEEGLFHPNCLHSTVVYIEGETTEARTLLHPAERALADKYGYDRGMAMAYDAHQRQREIEAQVRYWKRREVVALTDQAHKLSTSKVREWQATQRAHLSQYQFLNRDYSRESISGKPR